MRALLSAIAVWKRFGGADVLKGVDLVGDARRLPGRARAVRLGEIDAAALPQPAGADRRRAASSSKVKEIAGLPRRQAAALRRRMGMVFQNFELFPHLSADGQCRVRRRSA